MRQIITKWAGVPIAAALTTALIFSTPADARIHHHRVIHKSQLVHAKKAKAKPHVKAVPSLEGVVILEENTGKVVVSTNDTTLFNPASNVKVSTSLLAVRTWGPDYRFETEIRTDGVLNADGVLKGNLFVSGRYMLFGERQARELAKRLSAKGIKSIKGDLYITSEFTMDLRTSGVAAGDKLMAILDPHHKTPKLRNESGMSYDGIPEIAFSGSVKIGAAPAASTLLATHISPPLKDILKIMLCYSDNNMAERFGEMLGGPTAVRDFLIKDLAVDPAEVQLASTSGLYVNRLSPRAMMKVMQAFQAELAKHQLKLTDLLAVAGVDEGTLKRRLNAPKQGGSVTGKTGTLPETDNGASALSGEISTAKDGNFLFVIFNMHGDVHTFRARQNSIVTRFQSGHGGPRKFSYTPILPRVEHEDSWK